MQKILREAIRGLSAQGLRGADLKRALVVIEPLQDHPEMVEAAVKESQGGR
jgi:hypothetical protein